MPRAAVIGYNVGMWSERSTKQRCRTVSAAAAILTRRADQMVDACASPQRTDPVETITGELVPLCGALKFIGRRGAKILKPRAVGFWGRPLWMFGVRSVVERVPHGDVLILGTWNYPVLLGGVQIAQALAAGNRVEFKPAIGSESSAAILVDSFHEAGVPKDQLVLLDSSLDVAVQAIRRGPDLIVLTGAAETGRKVVESAAGHLSATIMELSGCDAVIVLPGADRNRLVDAIEFGLRFNGSATCIGPRRLMVQREQRDEVSSQLRERIVAMEQINVHPAARQSVADQIDSALESGAIDVGGRYSSERLRESGQLFPIVLDRVARDASITTADLFAPVLSVIEIDDISDAIELVNRCPYRLAASVFGPEREARAVAKRLAVGTVTVNDLIAPTGDPRLPFGGRGTSGFGVTRGEEGLIEMSAVRVVSTRRGRMTPHLWPRQPGDRDMLQGLLELLYGGGWKQRMAGIRRMIGGGKS